MRAWTVRVVGWLKDQLYGRAGPGRAAGPRGRALYLTLAVLPFLVGILAYLLIVVVVDPYDLRPWGLQPRIRDHRFPDTEWPLLINVVTKGDYDTVMVGASTLMGVTSDQMRRAFGSPRPVNLAYPLSAPDDMRETLAMVSRMPRLKHVILVMDHSQMLPLGITYFPARRRASVLSSDWAHANDFSISAAGGSLRRVLEGAYDDPAWAAMSRPTFMKTSSILEDHMAMRRIARAIGRYRGAVLGTPQPEQCGKYPFLDQVLRPSLKTLVDRGVTVDILFPPYHLAAYYDWIERRLSNDSFARGPVYPQLVAFKLCTVKVASAFGDQVRVTAADNDLSITGDFANYEDLLHMLKPEAYDRLLQHVANRDATLTPATMPAYAADLARNLEALQPPHLAAKSGPGASAP